MLKCDNLQPSMHLLLSVCIDDLLQIISFIKVYRLDQESDTKCYVKCSFLHILSFLISLNRQPFLMILHKEIGFYHFTFSQMTLMFIKAFSIPSFYTYVYMKKLFQLFCVHHFESKQINLCFYEFILTLISSLCSVYLLCKRILNKFLST